MAQTSNTVVGKAPGVAGAAQTTKVTATITAIDAATRAITLKTPQGKEVALTAGPEVKNFAQMKVGDQVNAEYVEALTLELKKGGGKVVARTEQAGAAGAKAGERPAGLVGRQVTIVADVVDVNAATQMVTLRGPQRTVELQGPRSGTIQADRERRSGRSHIHRGGRYRRHARRKEITARTLPGELFAGRAAIKKRSADLERKVGWSGGRVGLDSENRL
jgi:hypothetical protein